jgi:cell division protein FtsW
MAASANYRRSNRAPLFKSLSAVLRNGGSPDYSLILAVAGLLVLGIMMVYSATFDIAYQNTGSLFHLVAKHCVWVGFGVLLMIALAFVPYDFWQRIAVPILLVTVTLLVLVLILGDEVFGATRSFFGGSVQPAEPAKLAMVIYAAVWLVSKGDQIRNLTYGLLPFAVLVGLVAGFIIGQPDMSAAGLIVVVCFSMFFLAGADLFQLGIGSAAAGVTFWLVITQIEYVKKRLGEYVFPWQDPSGLGEHSQHSLIALGNGGLIGVGLGKGRQKFGYLYTQHTDSIFGVVGEELGFVGCMVVLLLFAVIAYRGFRIAAGSSDSFGSVLACGITCLLTYQALMNIAVSAGLIPFIGTALPFVSYGGSAITVSLASVGILLSVSRGNRIGKRSKFSASMDIGRRDRGARVSRAGRSSGTRRR